MARRTFLQTALGGGLAVLASGRLLGAAAAETAQGAGAGPELVDHLSRQLRLFPNKAEAWGGDAVPNGRTGVILCGDSGRVAWFFIAPEAGEYEVYLSYAAPEPGVKLALSTGGRGPWIEGLGVTAGLSVPAPESKYHNFERVRLGSRIHFDRGLNPLEARIVAPNPALKVAIRCVELVPGSLSGELSAERGRAEAARANTDWFVRAGYGVKFTWADEALPERGPSKPFPEIVDAFDVGAFADLMEEMGAGYVLFQLHRTHNQCPAPIGAWERAYPGKTSQRDLIGEIADRLRQKAIPLLLYVNSPILGRLQKKGDSGRFEVTLSEEGYVRIHREVLTEVGLRYGRKLAGYWFDAWNSSIEAYPELPLEKIYGYSKAGNPDRITAFNFWMYPVPTVWQDYWAGELNALPLPFRGRVIDRGPGKGFQAHGMVSIDPSWYHKTPGPYGPPQFSADALIAYVKANLANQAVTTINVGVYQDGTVSEAHRAMMRQLRAAVRG